MLGSTQNLQSSFDFHPPYNNLKIILFAVKINKTQQNIIIKSMYSFMFDNMMRTINDMFSHYFNVNFCKVIGFV